jgi:hypothetical protein
VEVITLRNPETVEARIWDKLNAKITNIMLAFGHVMEDQEDLLQMVLGMTSPTLFRELFAGAPQVPAESLGHWFDQKTATFGGRDVIATVKEIVGNCDRFDYQAVGKEVPPVDLPDLRPFVEAMLIQNRRRPKRGDDGSLGFKTPEAWLREVGVRSAYEGLIFDRSARGRDAVQRVVGVGHKIVEQALRQALDEPTSVAGVSESLLQQPVVIARIIDRITGRDSPVRSVVMAAEQCDDTGKWQVLRDWETVRRLNELAGNVAALRRSCAPPKNRMEVQSSVDAAVQLIEREVPKLKTGFRVPAIEALAVLWPGAERKETQEQGGETIAGDDAYFE